MITPTHDVESYIACLRNDTQILAELTETLLENNSGPDGEASELVEAIYHAATEARLRAINLKEAFHAKESGQCGAATEPDAEPNYDVSVTWGELSDVIGAALRRSDGDFGNQLLQMVNETVGPPAANAA